MRPASCCLCSRASGLGRHLKRRSGHLHPAGAVSARAWHLAPTIDRSRPRASAPAMQATSSCAHTLNRLRHLHVPTSGGALVLGLLVRG